MLMPLMIAAARLVSEHLADNYRDVVRSQVSGTVRSNGVAVIIYPVGGGHSFDSYLYL